MATQEILEEALTALQSANARVRDEQFYLILQISEQTPERLYPAWDDLVAILRKPEVSNKYVAIHLLANLVRVDTENKFEQIFTEFYQLLSHESPVVAPHVVWTAGKIMLAKPHLRPQIMALLLNIEALNRCRHPELLKSYVIAAFADIFAELDTEMKEKVLAFVTGQVDSDSPKTRKTARAFIAKWQKPNTTVAGTEKRTSRK